MEFHDSRLKDWKCEADGSGFALFHSCIHRAEGDIFDGATHESGWQDVRFDFNGMRVEGEVDLNEHPYADAGELWVNGKNGNGIAYLPAIHHGELILEMTLSPLFGDFKIHAKEVTSTLLGEFEHEHFCDANGEWT